MGLEESHCGCTHSRKVIASMFHGAFFPVEEIGKSHGAQTLIQHHLIHRLNYRKMLRKFDGSAFNYKQIVAGRIP